MVRGRCERWPVRSRNTLTPANHLDLIIEEVITREGASFANSGSSLCLNPCPEIRLDQNFRNFQPLFPKSCFKSVHNARIEIGA